MIQAALRRQQLQKRTIQAARAQARRLWSQTDAASLLGTWRQLIPQLMVVLTGIQYAAADSADEYVASTLTAQGLDDFPEGALNPLAFVGVASDGLPLQSLLMTPAVDTVRLLQQGMPRSRAMASGRASLEMIAGTQVGDVFRAADSVASVSRRIQMYARVLGPRPCSRCVILAGQVSSWKTAFKRHPSCSCSTLPTDRLHGQEYRTDERLYFESLSKEQQDRVFTIAGAQAIRDGADIGRVVNARRRASGLSAATDGRRRRLRTANVWGRDSFVTNELSLTGSRGQRITRLMPEEIYRRGLSQEETIRMLKVHGYIYETPRQRDARHQAELATLP